MKSFRLQFIECNKNGNCVMNEDETILKLHYFWCNKYNTKCCSKVCFGERIKNE